MRTLSTRLWISKLFVFARARRNSPGTLSTRQVPLLNAIASIAFCVAATLFPGFRAAPATVINGGAIIDHEAPRERRFVAVQK
jgi:hypothetical protein